jgi:hypothetical protein
MNKIKLNTSPHPVTTSYGTARKFFLVLSWALSPPPPNQFPSVVAISHSSCISAAQISITQVIPKQDPKLAVPSNVCYMQMQTFCSRGTFLLGLCELTTSLRIRTRGIVKNNQAYRDIKTAKGILNSNTGFSCRNYPINNTNPNMYAH